MEFIERSRGNPARVGILAGSFNPPTIAHFELLRAGGDAVDEVVCVVPKAFPHKDYSGATLEQRVEMLRKAAVGLDRPCSIATTGCGLFADIARECREYFGRTTQVSLLCGADAAERILGWDYGRAGFVEEMLEDFELLVAPRGSTYQPPSRLAARIRPLAVREHYHNVSSTQVRDRIRRGEPWEHFVPPEIIEMIREIYS